MRKGCSWVICQRFSFERQSANEKGEEVTLDSPSFQIVPSVQQLRSTVSEVGHDLLLRYTDEEKTAYIAVLNVKVKAALGKRWTGKRLHPFPVVLSG